MDPKLYKFLELVFIAGLLVAVLYLGSVFSQAPAPAGTGVQPSPTPLGQVLNAPTATAATPTDAAHLPSTSGAGCCVSTTPPGPTPSAVQSNYTIASGDTCIAIAARFEVTLQSLIELNNLDSECLIFAGDTLKIPQPAPTIAP